MSELRSVSAARAPDHAAPPESLIGTPWAATAAAACASAPYLARVMRRRPELLENVRDDWPEQLLARAIGEANAIERDPPDMARAMHALRCAKDAAHLGTAMADLARRWPLQRVTGAITDFADAAVRAAVSAGAREAVTRGELREDAMQGGVLPGFIVIAMGKMGAGELNYSSDIDFSVFFDAERFPVAPGKDAQSAAVRLVSFIVRLLEEIDADGYVFRTDLRLRPDPGSTRPAVSLAAAENYYQSLGQNWERAAFIKARAVAGDIEAGEEFLKSLRPFIWRKHLDFAAVADVKSIKRQILYKHGGAELENPVFNVKLGRGGIRDIELFVQTQQLILGGRHPALRRTGTLEALGALTEDGVIADYARARLSEAYIFFREVEHRIQMMEDVQTHDVPANPELRARLALLCGFAALDDFEQALTARRALVADIDEALFGEGESLATPEGSLIFTGVEDHAETLETIRKLGFSNPISVSQTIRGWHHGRIPAMRAERARELLTALTPKLLKAFGAVGDADAAFARFATFFSGLSAGVLVLSLLSARPALLDMLARLFGLAPVLAETLARRPALLDAMIEPHFAAPLVEDAPGARAAALMERIAGCSDFEQKLNAARRFKREEAFRIGVQVLEGEASAAAAGAAHADLAEACIVAMAEAALKETERLFGPQTGAFAVLALGKFGGRELAEASDLDIMVIYEAPEGAGGDFYTRLTQRLISALSAQTEEGALYEVDMALRPSGSKGPVAVRFSSFERYYADEAWTWELLALTRARPVAGEPELSARIAGYAHATLARRRERDKVLNDVADMRSRMARDKPGNSIWDLKLAPGGLIDIEFIAQGLQLVSAAEAPGALSPNTGEALARLSEAGVLAHETALELIAAFTLYSDLQQVLRVCGSGEPSAWPEALKQRLAAVGGAEDFAALETKLTMAQAGARNAFTVLIGPLGDGSAALAR